jgi:hypothetical protein
MQFLPSPLIWPPCPHLSCRAIIQELGPQDRVRVLMHLPRHSLECLVSAYCEWQVDADSRPFLQLMQLVPDLDFQIHQQACKSFPGMAWDGWTEMVHLATSDPHLRHDLTQALMHSLSSSARKHLFT